MGLEIRGLDYRFGGDMIWGQPDVSSIGISAQILSSSQPPSLLNSSPTMSGVYDAFCGTRIS